MDLVGVQRSFYGANGLNRPLDMSLTTEDIEGARPRKRSFTTNRCTDPLDPVYHLPSYTAPPPAQVRAPVGTIPTNYVADIPFSRPKPAHVRTISLDSLNVTDIEYAQPSHYRRCVRPLLGEGLTNSMNVSDINAGDHHRIAARGTNPLEPQYLVSTKNMWKASGGVPTSRPPMLIGDVEASKPRRLERAYVPPHEEVEGSHPQRFIGRVPHSSIGDAYDTYRKPVPTGSGAGSLKRGIVTKRSINPLDPNYSLLTGDYDSAYKLLISKIVT